MGAERRLRHMPESEVWIYLSPHLDDAVFSCGGLIRQQTSRGHQVSVWTVFTASPPRRVSAFAERFHSVWGVDGDPMAWRRDEDAESCRILGASHLHLGFSDVAHRWSEPADGWLYTSDEDVTGRVHPADAGLVHELADRLRASLPDGATVVCPLALGNHVDHQITRLAAERTGRDLVYFADYPYVRHHVGTLESYEKRGWVPVPCALSRDAITAWQDAALAHRSQITGFWAAGEPQLRRDFAGYAGTGHGTSLWRPPRATTRAPAGGEDDRRQGREPGLSFCILSGGGRPNLLSRLVASIYAQQLPAFEVIVCGHAVADPSYRLVQAIDEVSAGGLSRARNRAAEHARFDCLVFCDDDIELRRDWYRGLRPYLASCDALTTRILNPDGTRHWDWAFWRGHGKQRLLDYGKIDRDLYLTGGLMIVRADVWSRYRWAEDLGYGQVEDVEFSQRIISAGHRVGICTESAVLHNDDRHTQVGHHVFVRSEKGLRRLRGGTLRSMPKGRLLEIAAQEWSNGQVADAADCLRACRVRDGGSVIADQLLGLLYRLHGGNIEGNDHWRLPAPEKTGP